MARRAARVRAPVIVCWDLDNTLVDSGPLIRTGRSVSQAWLEAGAVPGMLAFAAELRARLVGAAHVVLTVRTRKVRAATAAWLERERFELGADHLWLVGAPEDKAPVWRALRQNAPLVVVDDLTYAHEQAEPLVYEALMEEARQVATVYVGAIEIARVRAEPQQAELLAQDVVEQLRLSGVTAGED